MTLWGFAGLGLQGSMVVYSDCRDKESIEPVRLTF